VKDDIGRLLRRLQSMQSDISESKRLRREGVSDITRSVEEFLHELDNIEERLLPEQPTGVFRVKPEFSITHEENSPDFSMEAESDVPQDVDSSEADQIVAVSPNEVREAQVCPTEYPTLEVFSNPKRVDEVIVENETREEATTRMFSSIVDFINSKVNTEGGTVRAEQRCVEKWAQNIARKEAEAYCVKQLPWENFFLNERRKANIAKYIHSKVSRNGN